MRNLTLPDVDDLAVLDKLARSRAAAAVGLRSAHPDIRTQYAVYEAAKGDPWVVNASTVLATFSDHLQALYAVPPVALNHVKIMRDGLVGACPMCGRDSLGTLDHYLPQANYPEFCFNSRNLVPACNRCNTARSNSVKGGVQGQRALQPYFDAFAGNRVMTVELAPDWRAPVINPIPFEVEGVGLSVVEWQIDNVVKPSGFVQYADPIWAALINETLAVFEPIPTAIAVRERLMVLERVEVAMSHSPNGWRACIYHGIRHNSDAVDFLAECIRRAID